MSHEPPNYKKYADIDFEVASYPFPSTASIYLSEVLGKAHAELMELIEQDWRELLISCGGILFHRSPEAGKYAILTQEQCILIATKYGDEKQNYEKIYQLCNRCTANGQKPPIE